LLSYGNICLTTAPSSCFSSWVAAAASPVQLFKLLQKYRVFKALKTLNMSTTWCSWTLVEMTKFSFYFRHHCKERDSPNSYHDFIKILLPVSTTCLFCV
jgi:hypothetical protein